MHHQVLWAVQGITHFPQFQAVLAAPCISLKLTSSSSMRMLLQSLYVRKLRALRTTRCSRNGLISCFKSFSQVGQSKHCSVL